MSAMHLDESLSWDREALHLSSNSLDDLFNNRIAAIRVPGFASSEECEAFCAAADEHGYDYYEGVVPPIGKIGITQYEAGPGGAESYFAQAEDAIEALGELSRASFDPLARVIDALSDLTVARVAFEEGVGSYFAGLVRQIRTALLHVDWAPLDGPSWGIGDIDAQLAWNIYLKAPGAGGECIVHNRPWVWSDEELKIEGSYAYHDSTVADAQLLSLTPRVGDLVIFNSRNFHEVKSTTDERITVSSFIGRKPNGELWLWS